MQKLSGKSMNRELSCIQREFCSLFSVWTTKKPCAEKLILRRFMLPLSSVYNERQAKLLFSPELKVVSPLIST